MDYFIAPGRYNVTSVLMNAGLSSDREGGRSTLLLELKDVLIGGDSTREEIEDPSCFNYLTTGLAIADTLLGKRDRENI